MGQIIILGAGTMAQEVTDLIEDIGKDEVIGYCVSKNNLPTINKPIYTVDQMVQFLDKVNVVRAIFNPFCYSFIKEIENMGFEFSTIIHPSCSISRHATIHPGVVINRLVSIGRGTIIKKHCLINRGCTIGHDCLFDEGVTLGPGVNVAGNVHIGKRVMLGMGSNVIQNAVIGDDQKIRAGSLVA